MGQGNSTTKSARTNAASASGRKQKRSSPRRTEKPTELSPQLSSDSTDQETKGRSWPSLGNALLDRSIEAWGFKTKVIELFLALLVLVGTVYLGIKANDILSKQNEMLESQLSTSAKLGRQQNQAALIQAYISSAGSAGFESEKERRMFHMSLDLYIELVQEDRKFTRLYTSMPTVTEVQLAEIISTRPDDADEVRQLFARINDVSQLGPEPPYRLVQNASFHIVIGTFRNPVYARRALESAKAFLKPSSFHPFLNIVQNENGLYLATMSGFTTRDEVLSAIRRERLQTQFSTVYASQTRGWRPYCSGKFEACGPLEPSLPPRK